MRTRTVTTSTSGHSKECRKRVEEVLSKDAESGKAVKRAEERKNRFVAEEIEQNVEENAKRVKVVEPEPNPEGASSSSSGSIDKPEDATDVPVPEDDMEFALDEVDVGVGREKRKRSEDDDEQRPTHYRQIDEGDDESGASGSKRERERGDEEEDESGRRNVRRTERDDYENDMKKIGEDPMSLTAVWKRGTSEQDYDVVEIFSQPRIARRARRRSLRGGWSMDVNFVDPITGRKWDLSDSEDQQRARKMLYKDKPKLLVASPPCTLFSQMQNLSGGVKDRDAWEKAVAMVEFSVEMCIRQAKAGRFFVFEHPAYASSWKLPCLQRLQEVTGSETVLFHMCRFGMELTDKFGTAPVYKPTRMCTNSNVIAQKLERKCEGGHRHVHLESGRPRLAAEYPGALCDAILDGLEVEIMKKREIQGKVLAVTEVADMCDPEEEREFRESMQAVDDVTGEKLDPVLVRKARMEEMLGFKEFDVYEYVRREEARNDKEGIMIGVRWVDVDKGTPGEPQVRSRLVGQEYAAGKVRDDLFAATPPLMASRMLVSGVASRGRTGAGGYRVMLLDVKKAFLYGAIQRKVYIELPKEDPMSESGVWVGKLKKAMYGTRDAPQVWQGEVRRTLEEMGFTTSIGTPCTYYNEGTDVRVVAHVDDFLVTGPREELQRFRKELGVRYKLKSTMLGPGGDEVREGKFLGRTIRWTNKGLEWEGDGKLYRGLVEEWGMQECRGVVTPGVKEEGEGSREEEKIEDKARISGFRRAAAKLNYMSLDNPKISYASKEISRAMANPTVEGEKRIKRVIRYLHTEPTVCYTYPWQNHPGSVEVFVDSDWAGCAKTRRSTSGGVAMVGAHCIGHWSRTQAGVALSSGEAELNSALKGGCEALGLKSAARELGWEVDIHMNGDSSSCKGTLSREGLGKMKHIDTKQLWMQEKIKSGEIKFHKVPRAVNCSDAMTHYWTTSESIHFKRMNIKSGGEKKPSLAEGGCESID